jgi:hypothetical protein
VREVVLRFWGVIRRGFAVVRCLRAPCTPQGDTVPLTPFLPAFGVLLCYLISSPTLKGFKGGFAPLQVQEVVLRFWGVFFTFLEQGNPTTAQAFRPLSVRVERA